MIVKESNLKVDSEMDEMLKDLKEIRKILRGLINRFN